MLRPGAGSPLTYDGLFPSLLQLAPVPAPALTLLAVLTPGKRGRGGQPGNGAGDPARKALNVKEEPRHEASAATGGRSEAPAAEERQGSGNTGKDTGKSFPTDARGGPSWCSPLPKHGSGLCSCPITPSTMEIPGCFPHCCFLWPWVIIFSSC